MVSSGQGRVKRHLALRPLTGSELSPKSGVPLGPPRSRLARLPSLGWAGPGSGHRRPSASRQMRRPPARSRADCAGAADHLDHPPPATDLGFLLHKHPDRVQQFEQSFGTAHGVLPRGGRGAVHGGAAARRRPGPAGALARPERARTSASASTSTTGRTPPRRCWRSRWPRCSAPRCAGAATPGRSWPTRRSRWRSAAGAAVPRRRRAAAPAVRAARLEGRGDAVPLDERFPEWGDSRYVGCA